LISSHNLAELESFVTDVCLIQNGRIITTSSIKNMKKTDKDVYYIKLDKVKGIKKIIDKNLEIIDDKQIKIICKEEDIPKITNKIVNGGYMIYEVRKSELSLEEVFLKKTGGNIID